MQQEFNLGEIEENIELASQLPGKEFSVKWNNFAEFFAEGIKAAPEKPFLIYYDQEGNRTAFTYRQFGSLVYRTARYLSEDLQVARGDLVATVMYNHYQTVFIYFALWTIGACVVPVNIEESGERKKYILSNSGSKVVFCCTENLEELLELKSGLPELKAIVHAGTANLSGLPIFPQCIEHKAPEELFVPSALADEALIIYTSGTTGHPKGVLLTQENLLCDADGITRWHGFTGDDCLLNVLPIHHVNGTIVTLVTPFYFRGTVVLNRRFSPRWFWRRIQDEGVTCVSVVPTLLEFLCQADENTGSYNLQRLRGVICGAGPLLVETALKFEKRFGVPIIHGYGLSETTCYSCFLPVDLPREERIAWLSQYGFPSIGVSIEHNEMAIIDLTGKELGEMERGEIVIRGFTVMKGYFNRPDANSEAFRFGWFRSGDEGFYILDEQGRKFFFITGRIKELIIRGGINISPLEIDDVLRTHPKVSFGMAVPFDNTCYGEEVAAYVVPKAGGNLTEEEIIEHCRGQLSFAKQPKVVVFGQEVPYTSTGKPKRLELRNQLQDTLSVYKAVQFKHDRN